MELPNTKPSAEGTPNIFSPRAIHWGLQFDSEFECGNLLKVEYLQKSYNRNNISSNNNNNTTTTTTTTTITYNSQYQHTNINNSLQQPTNNSLQQPTTANISLQQPISAYNNQ